MKYESEPYQREQLRVVTCGSVDDGKSTLVGRLLFDTKLLMRDQLDQLANDSRRFGTTGEDLDLALIVDGLEAEREQGITIDVAYRYFATPRRSFILCDAPGHEQYTRNTVTAASHAEVAVILVDARKGLQRQTRRHAYACSLLRVPHVVLAINKADLVDFDEAHLRRIEADFRAFVRDLGFSSLIAIPISARFGDNITVRSDRMRWYAGPPLLEYLEGIDTARAELARPLRLPIQRVIRPNADFRGYAGRILSGEVRVGERVVVAPHGRAATIAAIHGPSGELDSAPAGLSVVVTLAEELDISRGDVLVGAMDRPEAADQFSAHVIWLGEEPLLPGRNYILKLMAQSVPARVTTIKHAVDIDTLAPMAARTLALNEIGVCNVSTTRPIAFDSFAAGRESGAFILIDRDSNATVGAGMVDFALHRSANIHRQALTVSRAQREGLNGHRAGVLWLTGLSGSGKSTIANLVEAALHRAGIRTMLLDGDNIRHGLSRDLGFTDADRVENIRRIGEVAKLFVEAGVFVICSFISPFMAERRMVREMFAEGDFMEGFVEASVATCAERDPKGLYAKAFRGEIPNFTGVTGPYEAPENPELHLLTSGVKPETSAEATMAALNRTFGFGIKL